MGVQRAPFPVRPQEVRLEAERRLVRAAEDVLWVFEHLGKAGQLEHLSHAQVEDRLLDSWSHLATAAFGGFDIHLKPETG